MNGIDKSIEITIEYNIKEIRGTKRSAANFSPLTTLSPEEMRLVMERNPEFRDQTITSLERILD